jgi:hypothetical protein
MSSKVILTIFNLHVLFDEFGTYSWGGCVVFLFYIGSACVVFGLALEGFVLFLVGDIVNHYFLTTLPVYFSTRDKT